MTKEILTVDGMSCAHCQRAVEKAVSALPGVASAQVDLENKRLAVEFDSAKCSLKAIKEAVIEEGYTVLTTGDCCATCSL